MSLVIFSSGTVQDGRGTEVGDEAMGGGDALQGRLRDRLGGAGQLRRGRGDKLISVTHTQTDLDLFIDLDLR